MTYDDAADLFEQTRVGTATLNYNGLTRAYLLAMLRKRFPDEQALTAAIRAISARVDQALRRGVH